jgi:hypothetical protein
VTQTRHTCTTREVLVEANPDARISSLMVEVAHSVQEGVPPPSSGHRGAVATVLG